MPRGLVEIETGAPPPRAAQPPVLFVRADEIPSWVRRGPALIRWCCSLRRSSEATESSAGENLAAEDPVAGVNKDSNNLDMVPNETTGRADLSVGREEHSVGDREVTTTTSAAGKAGKKKKAAATVEVAAEEATPSVGQAGAQEPTKSPKQIWAQVWDLLGDRQELATEGASYEDFKRMLGRAMAMTAPDATNGPVCANVRCGKFGHTLAVCPVPTDMAEGDIVGCFFCNTLDHDADECPMMEWVGASTLVTHLVTNRAGMPPWRTRIDWVALAIENWDLVDFQLLPLTRDYVTKVYVPGKRWNEVNDLSDITDPLFENADIRRLKRLASQETIRELPNRRPLMEASSLLCYCRHGCNGKSEHAIFKNEYLRKYIPDMTVTESELRNILAAHERDLAATEQEFAKKVPKTATKERMGRRAMKKAAAAATAAAAAGGNNSVPGPSQPTTPAQHQVKKEEKEVSMSHTLLDMADAIGDVIDKIQDIVKSK